MCPMARSRSRWVRGVIVVVLTSCAASGDPSPSSGNDFSGPGVPDDGEVGDDAGGNRGDPGTNSGAAAVGVQTVALSTGCAPYGSDVYTPFASFSAVSSGSVASLPWRGRSASYPDAIEDFRGYGPGMPAAVECGSNKSQRDHLDVTAGCLDAVTFGGDKVGQTHGTSDGYYRSFALPYDAAHQRQVAWGDQGVEYRFYYSSWTGNVSNPGFKAFVRYLSEYDLYVGSWRMDGVVQIQKKQCGVYTILKRDPGYGPPAPNMWHTIRFEVVGNEQRLYLDGRFAMSTTDDAIKRGTAGIRIDSAEGAYIDDWRVYAP